MMLRRMITKRRKSTLLMEFNQQNCEYMKLTLMRRNFYGKYFRSESQVVSDGASQSTNQVGIFSICIQDQNLTAHKKILTFLLIS